MGLGGKAAIVGVGELKPTRYPEGETTMTMLARAGLLAIEDSGIPFEEIDGLLTQPLPETQMLAPSTMIEFLGIRANYAEVVDLGGATGAGMVWRAAAAIAAGLCTTCLCLTGARREPRPEGRGRMGGGGVRGASPYAEVEVPYGALGAHLGY